MPAVFEKPGALAVATRNLFRRNSVYVSSMFIGAFAFGLAFDNLTTAWWNNHNKGKLWADIRDKVAEQ